MNRKTGRASRAHSFLQVERLEDRNLLDASPPTAWVAVMPNDTNFSSQYGLNNTGQTGGKVDADIDAPEAWDITTGSATTVVGVVDTGIDYTHVDLYKNIWINQGEIPTEIRARLLDTDADGLITFWDLNDSRNQGTGKIRDLNGNNRIDGGDLLRTVAQGGWADGVSNDGDKYVDDLIGWDFANNDNDPYDDNEHGTHVAGIIGAIGNNGTGVTGINWRISMMALKFLGANGSGSTGGARDAIDYAVAHGAIASNHSWSMGSTYWQPLYDSMARAQAAGHIIIAAAGNGGSDSKSDNNDTIANYPSNFNLSNIIAVAAATSNDALTAYTNYGATTVDLAAPGVSINSTAPGSTYMKMGGTSMATPHVTGTIALLHTLHPEWSYSQLINQVLSTVDKVSTLTGKVATGGRLNAAKAVGAGQADTTGARIIAMSPNASGLNPATSVRVTFSEAIDLTTFTLADVVSFNGPKGAISITGIQVVAGSNDTQFDLTFSPQSTLGTYTLVLGPDIRDKRGNQMDQDRDGVRGESTQDRFTGNFSINPVSTFETGGIRINDLTTTVIPLVVNSDIRVSDLSVRLTLTHPSMGELTIKLRAPDGTEVMLFNRRGGTGDNLKTTLFDDAATKSLSQGTAPFEGTFRPEQALSAFDGKSARGTWELVVTDSVSGNRGRLNIFTLYIEAAPGSGASAIAETSEVVTTTSGSPDQSLDASVPASLRIVDLGNKATVTKTRSVETIPAVDVSGPLPGRAAFELRDLALSSFNSHEKQGVVEGFGDAIDEEELMAFFKSLSR